MALSLLSQGTTNIRDAIKTLVSHVGVATDQTAFSASQTAIDPANAGAGDRLIKSATKSDVNGSTFEARISINGTTEFTNKSIYTTSAMKGSARTDAITRSVRPSGLGIGVIAGDSFTIGVRGVISDAG